MKNIKTTFNNAFVFLYSLLLGVTPLLMYHKTSEIFEFNKMLYIYLFTLLVATLWIARMIVYKKIIFRNTVFTIPLLLFLASQILSTYFSIDRHTSLFGYYGRFNGGLLSIISYVILYFGFISNIDLSEPLKKVVFFMKVSILSSFGVILWGLPSKFGIDLSCWLFTKSLNTACWTNEFQPTIRMFSTLGQPNWLGAFLVVNFLFALYLYLSEKMKRRWVLLIYIYLNFLCILFTRSRSALLALGVGLLCVGIYIILSRIRGKKKQDIVDYGKKFIAPLALALVLGLALNFALNMGTPKGTLKAKSAVTTTPSSAQTITDSFEIRKLVWQGGYSVGLKYPLFGTGVETFAYAYNFLRPADHNMTSEWDFVYNKAHNELVNYFTTTGSLGLFVYLFLIGIVISRIKLVFDHTDEGEKLLAMVLLGAYISLIVSNFFGFSTTTINVLFYLIPAFIILVIQKPKDISLPEQSLSIVQKSLLFVPVLIFLYGASYLSLYFIADVHYARGENYRLTQEFDQALFYLYYADSLKSEHVYKDKIAQILAQKGFYSSYLSHTQNPKCPTASGDSDSCFILATRYEDEAIKASSKNVYYYRSQARNNYLAYQALGSETDFDRATKAIDQAQSLAPTDPRYPYMKALFFLGKYDSLDKPSASDKDLLQLRGPGPATLAIKLKPDFKDAYMTRGLIYSDLGDYKSARADFVYIFEKIDPNDKQAKSEYKRIEKL